MFTKAFHKLSSKAQENIIVATYTVGMVGGSYGLIIGLLALGGAFK